MQPSESILWFGLALTGLAWLALLIVVAHGRYVTEAVADGTYRKGPFRNKSSKHEQEETDE